MDQKLEHTASIVNAFVDLVDEEEKKQDILSCWKTFEIEVCCSVVIKSSFVVDVVLATTTIPRACPVNVRIWVCWNHFWSCPECQTLFDYPFIFTVLAASLESCRVSS